MINPIAIPWPCRAGSGIPASGIIYNVRKIMTGVALSMSKNKTKTYLSTPFTLLPVTIISKYGPVGIITL